VLLILLSAKLHVELVEEVITEEMSVLNFKTLTFITLFWSSTLRVFDILNFFEFLFLLCFDLGQRDDVHSMYCKDFNIQH